jgi:hypothetical protein
MVGLLHCEPSKSRYGDTQTAKTCQKAYNNHKYLCRRLAERAYFPNVVTLGSSGRSAVESVTCEKHRRSNPKQGAGPAETTHVPGRAWQCGLLTSSHHGTQSSQCLILSDDRPAVDAPFLAL